MAPSAAGIAESTKLGPQNGTVVTARVRGGGWNPFFASKQNGHRHVFEGRIRSLHLTNGLSEAGGGNRVRGAKLDTRGVKLIAALDRQKICSVKLMVAL